MRDAVYRLKDVSMIEFGRFVTEVDEDLDGFLFHGFIG
jgi:hypothetical protein